MLNLFRSYFAIIPVMFITILMASLRINIIYTNYTTNLWQGELSPFAKALVFLLRDYILNPAINSIASFIIVFLQSAIIISIFSFFKNKELKSFFPAWIFVLAMHINPSFIFISQEMISFLFILWSFKRTIQFIEEPRNKKIIFEIGISMGIATMFWSPSMLFVLFLFFHLNNYGKLKVKLFWSFIFSFIVPIIYVIAYYLYFDGSVSVIQLFPTINVNDFKFNIYEFNKLLSLYIFSILSLISIFFSMRFTNKQLRQIKSVFKLLWFFIFNTFMVYFFQEDNLFSMIIFLLFPFSIFISIFFNKIKQTTLAEFIHLTLLLTVVINFIYITANAN